MNHGCDGGVTALSCGAAAGDGAEPIRGGGPSGAGGVVELCGTFCWELLERECQQRRHRRIERLLKASRLALEKSWATLDLKRLPAKVAQQLRSLLSGDFLDRQENVLVFGPPGSGKTHAVNAVALELVRAGRRVLLPRAACLVQELLKAKRDLRLPEMLPGPGGVGRGC